MAEQMLPDEFADLERFAARWSLATERQRYTERLASSMPELQELYDVALPRMTDALSCLDKFDIDDLPNDARNLMRLYFSMVNASFPVESWNLESYDLSTLSYIMWGATRVTESVAQRVTDRTGVRFLAAYGASEVPVVTSNPVGSPDSWRLDSAGLPIHDLEMRVVDLETGATLESGATGEIQLRCPSMMTGYLPAEANDEAFADGWCCTGDAGWLEPEGWLRITDRVKEMIKVKGFQVAPAAIEAVLHGHPWVVDCAVFGVPDETAGEAVIAVVHLTDGAFVSVDELKALVADTLASYKRLADIVVLDSIPRLQAGKVLRPPVGHLGRHDRECQTHRCSRPWPDCPRNAGRHRRRPR